MTCSLLRRLIPPLTLLAVSLSAAAQDQAPANHPAFDVASVKLVKDCRGGTPVLSPGRFQVDCVSVRQLISAAYGLVSGMTIAARMASVVNGPSWLDTDLYNIAARTEAKGTTADVLGPMLRALLEDRFQLKVHKEPRETPVYELTVAGGKPNLAPMKEGDCTPLDLTNLTLTAPKPGEAQPNYCGGGRGSSNGSTMVIEITGMTMEELAGRTLPNYLDRPVVDKTGLTGRFNFQMEFAPERRSPPAMLNGQGSALPEMPPDPGPTIFNALAKLGLKLTAAKAPIDVIVVDHVERPSEN